MGENDVQRLEEKLNCMENKIVQEIANIRVHLAEDYVTKKDFTLHKSDCSTNARSKNSNTIAIIAVIVSAIAGISTLFR